MRHPHRITIKTKFTKKTQQLSDIPVADHNKTEQDFAIIYETQIPFSTLTALVDDDTKHDLCVIYFD